MPSLGAKVLKCDLQALPTAKFFRRNRMQKSWASLLCYLLPALLFTVVLIAWEAHSSLQCRLVKDTSMWTNKKEVLESEKAALQQVIVPYYGQTCRLGLH